MIRKDVLQEIGWGTSITEDFQLTLKLYAKGYKVVYTPYIQAPAEAVSTVKRLIRQRMRWAEGHSYNIRKMFKELMFGHWTDSNSAIQPFNHSKLNSYIAKWLHGQKKEGQVFSPSPLTTSEKIELAYLTPYYLQALLFMAGTFFWFMAEAVFKVTLPFWTEVWGWSLVFTNLFALPLMNLVGLFLEESEEKDYIGLFSFIALSYLVAPFQGYAALKGFLEKEEGPWFRTPKTGRITDVFTPGRFYRKIFGWLGRPAPIVQMANHSAIQPFSNPYLSLATANNRFENFKIRPKKIKRISRMFLAILLIISMNVSWLSFKVPLAQASPGTQIKTIEVPIYQYSNATNIAATKALNGGTYATGHNVGQYTSQSIYNSISYIAYYDATMGDLKFMKCGNSTCSSGNTITTVDGAMVKDSGIEADVGKYASLQVISGTPYIAYYDATSLDLKFVKCGNDSCSSGNTISVVDSTGNVGQYASLQVVSGTPYISYYDLTNTNLKFVKCGNDSCSSGNTINTVTDSNYDTTGQYASLQVVSGTPYISYNGFTVESGSALEFVKCGDDTCSSGNTISTVESVAGANMTGEYTSLQVVSGIPYISYYRGSNLNDLKFVKCGDDTCDNNPSNTISTIDSTDVVGRYTSLQIVSGIPYISYFDEGATLASLNFVKCGDDTCDNSPANTISSVDGVSSLTLGQYNSLQFLSGIPYISYYDLNNGALKFVKCVNDTCDNTVPPGNTISTSATGGFGVGFHLDIPESSVTVRYAFIEWRFIMASANTTCGANACQIDFAREEAGTTAYDQTGILNAHSAEEQPFTIRRNVTDKIAAGFNTYYLDTQLDADHNTDSVKLYVTYEYDDTSTTQTKTVRYPLATLAAQSAANTTDTLTSTLNPNLQEAGISIQRAWVEATGQVSGSSSTTIDVRFNTTATSDAGYAVGTGSTTATNMEASDKTTYDFVAMWEPTKVVASGASESQLNYNASNTIKIKNGASVMNLKGGELVITYNYSYYDTTNTTHRNTARYFIGQESGNPGTSYSTVGQPTVYLPESTLSNYNVYLKLVGEDTGASAYARFKVTVGSGTAVEYPSASTYYYSVTTETAGRVIIFIDISSNFSTNCSSPSSGCTVKVEALETGSNFWGIGAELILSYNFVIPTTGSTFNNIKTVWWYLGQETVKSTSALSGTFNTYIPEATTTFRSSAVIAEYAVAQSTNPRMQVDVYVSSASTTNVDSGHTGERYTYSAMEQGAFTGSAQTGLNYAIQVCTASTCASNLDALRGAVAWSTYHVSAPVVPEAVLIFLFLMPFLPRIVQWWKRKRNVNMKVAYANNLANGNCANVCEYTKRRYRKRMNSPNAYGYG